MKPRIENGLYSVNVEEYLKAIRTLRMCNATSTFGLEASWFQYKLFLDVSNIYEVLGNPKYIYLYRKDIVDQAISLYKTTQTGKFQLTKGTLNSESKDFEMNVEKVWHWLLHIYQQERGWNQHFDALDLKDDVLEITYEGLWSNPLMIVKQILGEVLNFDYKKPSIDLVNYKKMGDAISKDFARQFTERFGLELAYLTRNRGRWDVSKFKQKMTSISTYDFYAIV